MGMKLKEDINMKVDLKMKENTKKNKEIRNKNVNVKQDYITKKVNRMKKIEDIMNSSSPFVIAIIVQLLSSLVGMSIYGMYMAVQLAPDKKFSQIDIGEILNTSLTMDASLVISTFSAIVCMVVFLMWYIKQVKNDNNTISIVSMKFKHILFVGLLGIGLQVGFSFILNLIAMVKPSWFYNYGLMMEQLGSGTSIVSLIYVVVIAPISEELIFRGVLLNKAKKKLPLLWANVLQAFLFGLYHMNMIQGIYAFIIGMFLGSICNGYKSIYAAVVLHVIINLCGLLLGQMTISEQYQTPLVFSSIIIISIIGIILSMVMLKRDYTQKEEAIVVD
jgi:membrane protease YdiL (CAAX protease family)